MSVQNDLRVDAVNVKLQAMKNFTLFKEDGSEIERSVPAAKCVLQNSSNLKTWLK
jgi:hypothetical protein